MIKRAALITVLSIAQAALAHAQESSGTAQLSFGFRGEIITVTPNTLDAVIYASRFATVPASCDPFCVAPEAVAAGVETLIEGKVLDFLVDTFGQSRGLLVDARMPDARAFDEVFNFADAHNLVVFDNGPTQNDAGILISPLSEVGYAPEKTHYYRGGMQMWSFVGLTVRDELQ